MTEFQSSNQLTKRAPPADGQMAPSRAATPSTPAVTHFGVANPQLFGSADACLMPGPRSALLGVILAVVSQAPLLGVAPPVWADAAWFRFNSTFIASHYPGGVAFGSISAKPWKRAAQVHSSSCGGK